MNILVLSDLHIGPGARCKSMVPSNEPPSVTAPKTHPSDEKLFQSLLSDLHQRKIKIDYVIYPGDIADGGQIEQYEHFDKVATELHTRIGVDPSQVFFTPGNHDVNWSEQLAGTSSALNPGRFAQRFHFMSLSKALPNASARDLYDKPYWTVWRSAHLCVISVNTAALDGPMNDNHPGTISSETMREIDEFMSSDTLSKEALKVLLIHHHPLQYPNLFTGWKDFSIVQSEDDLFAFLGKHKIDFLIHGHRHQPFFRQHLCTNGHELFILAAGSFSHNFPSYVYSNISNQYHIICLHGRDQKRSTFRGELLSFSFSQITRWQPSVAGRDGIDGLLPFGPHVSRQQIIHDLTSVISTRIASAKICEYKDLVSAKKYVKYLTPLVLKDAVEEICASFGFRIIGSEITQIAIMRGSN